MSQTTDALTALLEAIDEPGDIHPALADAVRVSLRAALALDDGEVRRSPGRVLDFTRPAPPIAAFEGPDDAPPLPPAAI